MRFIFSCASFARFKENQDRTFSVNTIQVDYCVTFFSKGSLLCWKICRKQYVGFFALVLLVPLSIKMLLFSLTQ